MRIIVIVVFVGILASLGSALFYLMKERGGSARMARALTFRIGLSVALFMFLLFSHWMGWIQSTGLR
jgi:hypothetical protein